MEHIFEMKESRGHVRKRVRVGPPTWGVVLPFSELLVMSEVSGIHIWWRKSYGHLVDEARVCAQDSSCVKEDL